MPLFFWYSEPRTDEKRTKAMGAVGDYLEFGSTNPSISVQKRQFPPRLASGAKSEASEIVEEVNARSASSPRPETCRQDAANGDATTGGVDLTPSCLRPVPPSSKRLTVIPVFALHCDITFDSAARRLLCDEGGVRGLNSTSNSPSRAAGMAYPGLTRGRRTSE